MQMVPSNDPSNSIKSGIVDSSVEPEPQKQKDQEIPNLVLVAALLSGAMMVLAVIFSLFGFCAPQQSLLSFDFNEVVLPAIVWGVGSSIPLILILLAIFKLDFGPFQTMKRTIDNLLIPIFKDCTIVQIAIISILAGISEEMFFRWCLQGGLSIGWTEILGEGVWPGIIIAGVIFGGCHYITLTYALFATLMGIYLGCVMELSGTYLAPAMTHFIYDFVALCLIVRLAANRQQP